MVAKSFVASTVLRRLLKDKGAVLVSKESVSELNLVVMELAEDVAVRAVELCTFRKGKTVSKADIRQAVR
jgi:histone H3/H4